MEASKAVSDILHRKGRAAEIPQLQFNLLTAQAEAAAGMLKTDEMIALFKQALAMPGRSTAAMATAAKRIDAMAEKKRTKMVTDAGAMADALTKDTRTLLIQAASTPNGKHRQTALRALLMFAPLDNVNELLDKTEKD